MGRRMGCRQIYMKHQLIELANHKHNATGQVSISISPTFVYKKTHYHWDVK